MASGRTGGGCGLPLPGWGLHLMLYLNNQLFKGAALKGSREPSSQQAGGHLQRQVLVPPSDERGSSLIHQEVTEETGTKPQLVGRGGSS